MTVFLSIDTVLGWSPDSLDLVADALLACRSTLVGLQDELDDANPTVAWPSGTAADYARTEHVRLGNDLGDLVAEVSMVLRAVDLASASVRSAQLALDGALANATSKGLVVDRVKGTVADSVPLTDEVASYDRMLVIEECAAQITQALRAADHADGELAEALLLVHGGAVEGGATLEGSSTIGTELGDKDLLAPPTDATEADNRSWWDGLSAEEQEAVVTEHPEWVGNTDGIPAGIRDRANRAQIDGHRAELEAKIAELENTSSWGQSVAWHEHMDLYKEKLEALDAIETTLANPPARQLLVLDMTGSEQVRAAVAVGDVDTADHVAVFTPGFTSTVQDGLVGYDQDMHRLHARTSTVLEQAVQDEDTPAETVATVTWLGYEAPQWDTMVGQGSVFVSHSAEVGGADLAGFYRGIDASRDSDPHLTALGHSYGSTATGHALQEPNGVDDVVIFGSPGMGVDSLSDLDVSGHVYRIEAHDDIVADSGSFGADPSSIDGVIGLDSGEVLVGGELLVRSDGHSEYFSEGTRDTTTSLHNMAAVVAGRPESRVTAP